MMGSAWVYLSWSASLLRQPMFYPPGTNRWIHVLLGCAACKCNSYCTCSVCNLTLPACQECRQSIQAYTFGFDDSFTRCWVIAYPIRCEKRRACLCLFAERTKGWREEGRKKQIKEWVDKKWTNDEGGSERVRVSERMGSHGQEWINEWIDA